RTRRPDLIAGSVGIVVVGGVLGGRALAVSASQLSSFRTAMVKKASVSQTEQRSGIVEPVAQGTVAFPVSGTITSVAVQPGQAVTAGQTLATLDPSALQAAVTAQQANLAAAQLTLSNALNGVSSTPSSNRTATTTAPQQSGASQQCISDLQTSLDAQQKVASAQSSLAQAESALDAQLASASPSSGSTSQTSTQAPTASASSSTSGPSSAELVADQAAVDAAQAN